MIVTRKTINEMMGFAKYYYGKNYVVLLQNLPKFNLNIVSIKYSSIFISMALLENATTTTTKP